MKTSFTHSSVFLALTAAALFLASDAWGQSGAQGAGSALVSSGRGAASLPSLSELAVLPGGWRNALGENAHDVPGSKLVIAVRERSLLSGSEVLVGDVARVSGATAEIRAKAAQLVLCAAPRPGQTAQVTRQSLESALLRGGLNLDMIRLEVPRSATAELETEFLRYDEVVRLVSEALYADMSAYDRESIQLTDWRVPTDARIPAGNVDKRVELSRNGRETGNVSFQILAIQDGRVRGEIKGAVSVDVLTHVVKVAAAISRGGVIQPAHLVVEPARLSTVSNRAVRDMESALGKVAARDLHPGDTLETPHLRVNLLVRRNDMVIMQVQTSAMRLQAKGVAQGQGGIGDTIPVVNPTSRKEVLARIVGPQRVEVIY